MEPRISDGNPNRLDKLANGHDLAQVARRAMDIFPPGYIKH